MTDTTDTTDTTARPAQRFDRRLLAPMILGSILNPVNSSIIAVALVPIGQPSGHLRARPRGWSRRSTSRRRSGSHSLVG